MAFQQVGILGLGLIGTSLGLALKPGPSPPRIVGFDINAENGRRAVRQGAIDRSCGTVEEVCQGADVVILATPVRVILRLLPEIAPHLEADTLVTDTGGTKGEIVRVAENALGQRVPFVGGHPLAGRLTAGVDQASASLYRGVVYCLTPAPGAAGWAVDAAVRLVESVGAQPYFLDPDEHDALLAAISHLPYFASVALVNALASQSAWPEMAAMAAGGFRAASSLVDVGPEVWADIAATNGANITRQLDALIESLAALRQLVGSGDEALVAELSRARAAHQLWLANRGEAPTPSAAPAPAAVSGRFRWMDRLRRP